MSSHARASRTSRRTWTSARSRTPPCDAGLEVLGYTTQAQFLVNCGITDVLAESNVENALHYAPLASEAQKLLSPAEMGELFKVLAVGRGSAPGRCSGSSEATAPRAL